MITELNRDAVVAEQQLPLLQNGLGDGGRQRTERQARHNRFDLLSLRYMLAKIGGIAVNDINIAKSLTQALDERPGVFQDKQIGGGYPGRQQCLRYRACAAAQLDDQAGFVKRYLLRHMPGK